MKKIALVILFASLILVPVIAQAEGLVPCGGSPRCCETPAELADPVAHKCVDPAVNPCEYRCILCHLFVMFDNVLDFVLFNFIPPVAVLMLVWGGIKFYTAAENPVAAADAKKLMTSVVIGMVIVYSAWLIISLFFAYIGLSAFALTFTGPTEWFKIDCLIP